MIRRIKMVAGFAALAAAFTVPSPLFAQDKMQRDNMKQDGMMKQEQMKHEEAAKALFTG